MYMYLEHQFNIITMGLRIPTNQIITNKYTSGKEYMFVSTYREYIGYYYELKGKTYAGKEFNINAPEIILIHSDQVNKLLTNPNTYIYGKVSGTKIVKTKVVSAPFTGNESIRYFIKKLNTNLIKEVDEVTFTNAQSDPIYTTLSTYFTYAITEEELNKADTKMSGIKAYLQYDLDNIKTSSDESNPYIL